MNFENFDADPMSWDHGRRPNRPFTGLYKKPLLRQHSLSYPMSLQTTAQKPTTKQIPTAFYLQQVYLSRDPSFPCDPYASTNIEEDSFQKPSLFLRLLLNSFLLLGKVGQMIGFLLLLLLQPIILTCKILAGIEWELFVVFAFSVWLCSRADVNGGMTRKEAAKAVSEIWRKEQSIYSLFRQVKDLGKSDACKLPGEKLTNGSRRFLDPSSWGIRNAYGRWLTYEEVLRRSVPGRPDRTK
ncbi:hypothetical protein F5884DRAFT_49348 [Xylogone sp. PMI_703]|nr:hypothetical protein F5884DRAFT_49348 [Xylogone sp. PMI_703]